MDKVFLNIFEKTKIHQKLNRTLPTDPVQWIAIELLDTKVFSGSVKRVGPVGQIS